MICSDLEASLVVRCPAYQLPGGLSVAGGVGKLGADAGAREVTVRCRLACIRAFRPQVRMFLTPLLLSFLCTCGRAQTTVDALTFFALPSQATQNTLAFSRQEFRAPWVENAEFRTETRDFDFAQQRYTLRLSPSTRGKVKAQTALADLQGNRPDFAAEEAACDLLRKRYEDWLDLYLTSTEIRLSARLDTILADRRTVLERLSASLDFDWSELVNLNQKRTDLALRKFSLLERRRTLLARYGLQSVELDFSGFPSLSELELTSVPLAESPDDPEINYDLELAAREMALEKSEQKQFLDFVQAEYNGPHGDPFRERFAVGVGFQFPNGGNQKLKIRELELEQQSLIRKQERELEEERQLSSARLDAIAGELGLYLQVQELFSAEAAELDRIAQRLRRREGFDPLPLLSIEERKVKNELRTLDARRDLLEAYLELRENDLCEMKNGELWTNS